MHLKVTLNKNEDIEIYAYKVTTNFVIYYKYSDINEDISVCCTRTEVMCIFV
jgi:predicted nuclease of predicted toxin-antitoxin system